MTTTPPSPAEGESISASPSGIRTDTFMGIPIRIARRTFDNLPSIPINDIADGIDYDRSTLRQLYQRNEDLLKEFSGKVMIPTTDGGMQPHVCLTREGVIGILMKLDYNRIKSTEKKDRIVKFQQWAIKKVNSEMQVQVKLPVQDAPRPSGAVTDTMQHYMEAARAAHREMGVPLDLAMSKALVLAGRDLHMDLTGFARLLPATEDTRFPVRIGAGAIDTQGYLSASEIAQYLNRRNGGNLRGKHINTYLKQNGYIYPRDEDGRYCMTDKGSQYGKVFPFAARSGHVDYFLRWKPEVMQASGLIRE